MKRSYWVSLIILILFGQQLFGQYFGKNKPQYENIDFKILATPHFEIYHYLENRDYLIDLAKASEGWYRAHQVILKDTFNDKNPILFYNDHPDFQQTNTITGDIGVGTGGVTEGLKNRVIMPLAQSVQQTHHVLGHELVHAFQYHMVLGNDSLGLAALRNLPLFMVEGLAEYLSIGRYDAHTAMWMRDAVLNEDIPEIKDLNNPEYFPYRYGHAFWAFIAGRYGDFSIKPFFINTAKHGLKIAAPMTFGITLEELSKQWVSTLKEYYQPLVEGKEASPPGKTIVEGERNNRVNVSPAASPNGRYIVYLSDRSGISLNMYLADIRTGEILKEITSTTRDAHLDNISFLESTGTWSPDSEKFAIVGFSKGNNKVVIRDAATGDTEKEFFLKGVPAFNNPAWSPDKRYIVVHGIVQGQPDLYLINVETERIEQLTNDMYAEMQPSWLNDSTILFATDQLSMDRGRIKGKYKFNIGKVDISTAEKSVYNFFYGADNLNPIPDAEGNIWFLSDWDGYRNIYVYKTRVDSMFKMTDLAVGISGITRFSSALSVSERGDNVVYTPYNESRYSIQYAKPSAFLWESVDQYEEPDIAPTVLPAIGLSVPGNIVSDQLENLSMLADYSTDSFRDEKFKPRFKLDFVTGGAGGGVGFGGRGVGTGLAGGINMIFSSITGNQQLYATVAVNGEIYDIGGVVQYLNRSNRFNWGISIGHIPQRTGGQYLTYDTLSQFGIVPTINTEILRIYQDQIGAFVHYPFNRVFRLEGGVGTTYNYFRLDRYKDYYTYNGAYIGGEREKIDVGDEILVNGIRYESGFLQNINTAFVGDNSTFGMTSPIAGYRMRVGVEKYFGLYNFETALVDLRRYFYVKPFSFAFRAMHYGRLGEDAQRFYPIYLGQMGLVRGISYGNSDEFNILYDVSFNQLSGSKFLLGGAEVRLPFTGPPQIAVVPSRFLFTQLVGFMDAGYAFSDYKQIFDPDSEDVAHFIEPEPIVTVGIALRVNVFNALIIEPYYAWPLKEKVEGVEGSGGVFGFNLIPGW